MFILARNYVNFRTFTNLQLTNYFCILLLSVTYMYLDWTSLFILNIFVLLGCLLSYNYITTFGLISINLFSTFFLTVKTWSLLFSKLWVFNKSSYWYLGSYSSVTDAAPINLSLTLDLYNLSYISLTLSIGCWAIFYAYNYMRNEPRIFSFTWLLLCFLYSMVLLLAGNSFSTVLLGWELIGSFSFLLINFWTTRVSTFKAALKAFFFNKLSDLALLILLILFFFYFSSGQSSNLNLIMSAYNVKLWVLGLEFNFVNIFLFFLSICCFCKSAQFGFHVWLPDSMEAPVPASALIHSATLVSAGIYLFGRVPSYILDDFFYSYISIFSSFTAFYGGIIAAYQTDLKRVLAYSTISHCGFLFFILTLDNYYNLFIYLHLHGWFKSLSFMCAGNIIGSSNNYQDYRRMGGVNSSTRLEQLILCLSIVNLGSMPFLLGFFNKHYLLILFNNSNIITLSSIFVLLASFTGIFYSIKFVYGVFYSCDKRHIALKINNSVLYNDSKLFNNSTGTQLLNLISLVNLSLIISLTAFLVLVYTNSFTTSNLFSDYYSNTTALFYINIYTLVSFNVFYYKNFRALLLLVILILLKILYLCI